MTSIDDVLKKAKPLTKTVPVCLDGELLGRRDELSVALAATAKSSPDRARLAAELDDVQVAIRDASVDFTFRGWNAYRHDEWEKANADDKGRIDTTRGAAEIIAACCVDPVMTVDQARELLESVNQGTASDMFDAAYNASKTGQRVPFSVRGSASTPATASK